MCGENQTRQLHRFRLIGSPPHVRGKLSPRNNTIASHGITPACARKTQGQTPSKNGDKDHPRMCGENPTYQQPDVHRLGSPPHVRGKPHAGEILPSLTRITPACAGKTYSHGSKETYNRDHPRMCGENLHVLFERRVLSGSPPHVRGKPYSKLHNRNTIGITPACAGKTQARNTILAIPRDHPRMCGENALAILSNSADCGSPPHVRGKQN